VSKLLNVIVHLLVAIPGAVFGAALGFGLAVTAQEPRLTGERFARSGDAISHVIGNARKIVTRA
jgi:hypothetical protein